MVEEAVRDFIVGELSFEGSKESLSSDYPLLERQVLDSLGLFELVSFLESEFAIEIQDEELIPQNFQTLGDIARFVQAKKG